jgi:hypothetical protein
MIDRGYNDALETVKNPETIPEIMAEAKKILYGFRS